MTDTLDSLDTLLVHELRDLYSAETQLTEALPNMSRAASHDDLKATFDEHLEETRGQVERLRQIFDQLGESPEGERCEAMEGLVQEGEEVIEMNGEAHIKDAALIAAAQRVEHYEIAGYGTAQTYADELGLSEPKRLLDETLSEEKSADKKLGKLATGGWLSSGINEGARKEPATRETTR
jgi:ferritin-like metal-binding protein YciE